MTLNEKEGNRISREIKVGMLNKVRANRQAAQGKQQVRQRHAVAR